jgi:hypothetical protein
VRAGIDEYQSEASVSLPTFLPTKAAASSKDRVGPSREAPAMPVPSEPFAAVYEDRNRLGVIVARTGRGGFEAYAADDHSLGDGTGGSAACLPRVTFLLVALVLGNCSSMQRELWDDEWCKSFEYRAGTREYAECHRQIDQRIRAAEAR